MRPFHRYPPLTRRSRGDNAVKGSVVSPGFSNVDLEMNELGHLVVTVQQMQGRR